MVYNFKDNTIFNRLKWRIMMNLKKIPILLLCVVLAGSLAACSKAEEAASEAVGPTIEYATQAPESLEDVLDLLYQGVTTKGLQDAGEQTMLDLFHMESEWMMDFAVRFTDGRYGVCDAAIVHPAEGYTEEVAEALRMRRDDRIAEFENYDVHDSLNIAKNAEVITRGDYVILLMLTDVEAAERVILEQIPG